MHVTPKPPRVVQPPLHPQNLGLLGLAGMTFSSNSLHGLFSWNQCRVLSWSFLPKSMSGFVNIGERTWWWMSRTKRWVGAQSWIGGLGSLCCVRSYSLAVIVWMAVTVVWKEGLHLERWLVVIMWVRSREHSFARYSRPVFSERRTKVSTTLEPHNTQVSIHKHHLSTHESIDGPYRPDQHIYVFSN